MDLKDTLILDAADPLSKALNEVLSAKVAVIVMKNGSYIGLIDDRSIPLGTADSSKIKCENCCIKTPALYKKSTIIDKLNAFLAGHFKALPLFDEKHNVPLGLITRVDVLKELMDLKLLPKRVISEVMHSPVYSLDINSKLADAKSKMKEYDTHRLLVTNKGYPYGIISTFDLAATIMSPKGHRGERMVSEIKNPEDQLILDFIREHLVVLDREKLITDAIEKMISETTSHVLVVSDKKPVGIFAAIDVFKIILDMLKESKEIDILISGLDKDDQQYYNSIKSQLSEVLNKFSKSFNISSVFLHIKRGKSVYTINMSLEVNNERLSFSAEDYGINDAIAHLSREIYTILSKKKGIVKNRKKTRSEE